jgi:hypothetical protein
MFGKKLFKIFFRNFFWNFKLIPLLLIIAATSGHMLNSVRRREAGSQRWHNSPFLAPESEAKSIKRRSAEPPRRHNVPFLVPANEAKWIKRGRRENRMRVNHTS